MQLVISRSFVSFSRKKRRASLVNSGVLGRCGRLIIVGDLSGSRKVPKLQLKVTISNSRGLVSRLRRGLPI